MFATLICEAAALFTEHNSNLAASRSRPMATSRSTMCFHWRLRPATARCSSSATRPTGIGSPLAFSRAMTMGATTTIATTISDSAGRGNAHAIVLSRPRERPLAHNVLFFRGHCSWRPTMISLRLSSRKISADTTWVDGNQLCDLGHATQAILFYRGLRAMAQSEQSLDIGI